MPWVRIDDHFDEHKKVAPLSDAAFRASVEALCYSNRSLTDGFLEKAIVSKRWARRAVKELISRGLWEEVDGGFRIHDYEQYQLTSEQILAERAAARARMQELRGRRGRGNPSPSPFASSSPERSGEQAPEHDAKFARSSVTPTPTPEGSKNPSGSGGAAPSEPEPAEWNPGRFIQRRGWDEEVVSDE